MFGTEPYQTDPPTGQLSHGDGNLEPKKGHPSVRTVVRRKDDLKNVQGRKKGNGEIIGFRVRPRRVTDFIPLPRLGFHDPHPGPSHRPG